MRQSDNIASKYFTWEPSHEYLNNRSSLSHDIEAYAITVAKNALLKAASNAKLIRGGELFILGIDLNSITDPSNIQL